MPPTTPDQTLRMPGALIRGRQGSPTLEHLLLQEASHLADEQRFQAQDDAGERLFFPGEYLFGYRLPDFQRPPVWTREQQVRLNESLFLGIEIGRFVVTQAEGHAFAGPIDRLLIDGYQRLGAIHAYVHGQLTVFGLPYAELHPRDRRRYLDTLLQFTTLDADATDEQTLRLTYDRMNFGGTPHLPGQEAVQDAPGLDSETFLFKHLPEAAAFTAWLLSENRAFHSAAHERFFGVTAPGADARTRGQAMLLGAYQ